MAEPKEDPDLVALRGYIPTALVGIDHSVAESASAPSSAASAPSDTDLGLPAPYNNGLPVEKNETEQKRVSSGAGELFGGITGAAISNRVIPAYQQPDIAAAKTNYLSHVAKSGKLSEHATNLATEYADQINALVDNHKNAQSALTDAQDILNVAKDKATSLGLDAEAIGAEMKAGDKWNTKIVGELGPGGDSVAEAAKNYRIQKGLPAGYVSTRSGIAMPYTPSSANSAKEEAAVKEVKDALSKQQEAQKAAAQARIDMEKAQTAGKPAHVTKAEGIAATAQADKAAAKVTLEELEKAKSFLSKIPGFNTIMGGLSGAELVHAYNEFKAGNTFDGVMSGLSGVGGLVSLVPHPVAKVVGTAMSLPPLAYQGYQLYQNRKNRNSDSFDSGSGGQSWDNAPAGALPTQ